MSSIGSRATCIACKRAQSACYCHLLKDVRNEWPVVVLQHAREAQHALNTARIAQLSLAHCLTVTTGDELDEAALAAQFATEPALIYPGAGSRPVAELAASAPRPLLFIDANWRKSRRLFLQSPWLQALPRYVLQPRDMSRYRIRKEPRPGLISTLEAIVAVLDEVEGDKSEASGMLAVMDWMVERQIAAMGEGTYLSNYGCAAAERPQ